MFYCRIKRNRKSEHNLTFILDTPSQILLNLRASNCQVVRALIDHIMRSRDAHDLCGRGIVGQDVADLGAYKPRQMSCAGSLVRASGCGDSAS